MARPSVQVSIQGLNETVYLKHRFFVVPEKTFDIAATFSYLLEAKVNSISLGINEEIGVAELEYPNRPFGSHIGFCSPIAIALDNADNVVFRGFLDIENGSITSDEDILKAKAYDYKWLIGKISKIRGKIYTGDNNQAPSRGGLLSLRAFSNVSLFEKYRYQVADSTEDNFNRGDVTGYVGSQKTVFNEDGIPNAATEDINASNAVAFKFDQDPYYRNYLRWHQRVGDQRYLWNYATILEYIARYYIENVFEGWYNTTRVQLNRTGLSKILRYGEQHGKDLIIPWDFDITGLSPTEAIDKVVKEIPGSWFWRIVYYKDNVIIDIDNNTDSVLANPGKSLYLGSGGKLTNITSNDANVKSASVERSIVDSISHAVAVGNGLEVETSIEYIPGWEQYLRSASETIDGAEVPPLDDENWEVYNGGIVPSGKYISNFKNPLDFQMWVDFVNRMEKSDDAGSTGKLQEVLLGREERYAKIFRFFVFPTYKWDIIQWPYVDLGKFDLFKGYASSLDDLIFPHVVIPRKILGPITNYSEMDPLKDQLISDEGISHKHKKSRVKEQSPFVFLYDDHISQVVIDEDAAEADTELLTTMLEAKRFIVPSHGSGHHKKTDEVSYSLENENRLVVFDKPQYARQTVSTQHMTKEAFPNFGKMSSRNVFVTCRIVCDVPIIEDKIKNREYYGNARLVSQEIDEKCNAVVRVNAYFPVPYHLYETQGNRLEYLQPTITRTGALQKTNIRSQYDQLIDWNELTESSEESALIISDLDYLKQIIQVMIGDVPVYNETIDVDLGRVDTSYLVGDRINKVVNSELSDGTGGYYGLKAIINRINYTKVGDTDAYTCSMSMNNFYVPSKLNTLERD